MLHVVEEYSGPSKVLESSTFCTHKQFYYVQNVFFV